MKTDPSIHLHASPGERTARIDWKQPWPWVELGVLVLWLAVMAAVWWRESGSGGSGLRRMGISPEVLLVAWSDYDHWMWIEQNGHRLGWSHLWIRPNEIAPEPSDLPDEGPHRLGYRLQSRTRVEFHTFGLSMPIDVEVRVDMNLAFEMETFEGVLQFPSRIFSCQAFTEDNNLFYRVNVEDGISHLTPTHPGADARDSMSESSPPSVEPPTAGRDMCGRSPLKESILLREAIAPILTRTQKFHPGQRWTTRASNPLTGTDSAPIHVSVEGREELLIDGRAVNAWRLSEQVGSLLSTAWYDEQGELVRRDVGGGLRLIRIDRQDVHAINEELKVPIIFPKLDRAWIKTHLDPAWSDRPLGDEPAIQALDQLWTGF